MGLLHISLEPWGGRCSEDTIVFPHDICFSLNLPQAYSAMLLGFLVVDSEGSRKAACTLLRSGSLTTVTKAIRRCLDFYSYTGAITEECKAALGELLENLEVAV